MLKFKELNLKYFNNKIEAPSVSLNHIKTILHLRFDSKDRLIDVGLEGFSTIWLSAISNWALNKTVSELKNLSWKELDHFYKTDQLYWDTKQEKINNVFFPEKEHFLAAVSLFLGKEALYKPQSSLVCRCFDVRENDILGYLKTSTQPSLEDLSTKLKAGMGCRSCLDQLRRWLPTKSQNSKTFKNRSYSDWVIEIDYLLSCFPKASEWKMELKSFRNNQVMIEFSADVKQSEEEKVGQELQSFMGAGLDPDLSFFLVRSRHL